MYEWRETTTYTVETSSVMPIYCGTCGKPLTEEVSENFNIYTGRPILKRNCIVDEDVHDQWFYVPTSANSGYWSKY